MSFGATASSLWKNAPIWKGLVFAAGVFTVLAVVATIQSGGPGGGQSGGQGTQQATVNPTSSSGGGSSGGTSGGTPTRTRSPTAPAGVPSNVVVHVPSASNPESEARIVEFISFVDAANLEQRMGERCARMARAIDTLERIDYKPIGDDPSLQKRLTEARQCKDDIVSSDRRLDALETAHKASQSDSSVTTVERLARASSAILPFDETRDRYQSLTEAREAGQNATEGIKESDQRIANLTNAATNAPSGAPPHALAALATATQAVTSFDRARMADRQLSSLKAGEEAVARIQESEERLADLSSSLALARSTAEASVRQPLIDSVAALTPFDNDRATPNQQAMITEARALAAGYAMDQLLSLSRGFSSQNDDPELHQQLMNLKEMINENGGVASPTSEQKAALKAADVAVARLEDSNRRLRVLRDASAAWQRNPGPTLEGTIKSAYAGVQNSFDQQRLEGDLKKDFQAVEAAVEILQANSVGLKPANKAVVPIFVTGSGDQDNQLLVRSLRDALALNGYYVVSALEEAAVSIEVSTNNIKPSSVTIGSRTVKGAVAQASMTAKWTFGNKVFIRAAGEGRDVGRSFESAKEDALTEAAQDMFENFDTQVNKNGGT